MNREAYAKFSGAKAISDESAEDDVEPKPILFAGLAASAWHLGNMEAAARHYQQSIDMQLDEWDFANQEFVKRTRRFGETRAARSFLYGSEKRDYRITANTQTQGASANH